MPPYSNHERCRREAIGYLKGFRGELFSEHPFWSIISAKLKDVIVTDGTYKGVPVPTAATDGELIIVNCPWFLSQKAEPRKWIFLHEVGHNALGHQFRRGDRKPKLWNGACDQELNLILKELGGFIPNWLCDDKYKGMSAERIYSLLKREQEQKEREQQEKEEEEGSGCEEESEEESDQSGDPGEDMEENDEGSQSDESNGDSAAGDSDSTIPQGYDEPGQIWDATSSEGKPLTDEELSKKMEELANDIQTASMISKRCGKGSSPSLQRSIDRITKPKMNWRRRMDKWVKDKGKPSGRSWSRLDRRAIQQGLYQPAEIKEGMDWLVVAVDISYSISHPEFRAFMNHLDKIRSEIKVKKLTILPFNETIQQSQIVHLKPTDKTPKKLKTGGGTSFAPIFNWLKRQPRQPEGVIVFTDLCCEDYGKPTTASVLWASTDEVYTGLDGWYSNVPPFGDVVQVDISSDN